MKTPSDTILHTLKTEGPQTTQALADRLGISRQATRQQVERLKSEGLILHVAEKGHVGRPRFVWKLSTTGHGAFPDGHAEALVGLIAAVRSEFGDDGLSQLISHREADSLAAYQDALSPSRTLQERVARLADLRTAEGYMAAWSAEPDGVFLLIESHCPICAAATACQGFCRSELSIFRQLLGPGVEVERTEHLLGGARRCAYRIQPRN
ncbi:MAG TPA: metalloregulator ArsR/SmtB family transcription factor [Caulobacteraceae bacterium]